MSSTKDGLLAVMSFPPDHSLAYSIACVIAGLLPRYQYQPLKRGEIRYLELLPGELGDPVSCQLHHKDAKVPWTYQAVSYVWGTEPHDHPIVVGGGSHFITPNLEAALKEFRARGCCHLWIDAICIDQKNVQERNEQIRLMAGIYSNCKELFVWLGIGNEQTDVAMDKIEELEFSRISYRSWHFEMKLGEAVACLLKRPWFRRAWVVQEYVLGNRQDVHFFAGSKMLSHSAMLSFSRLQIGGWKMLRKDFGNFDELIDDLHYLNYFLSTGGAVNSILGIKTNTPSKPLYKKYGPRTMEFWLENSRLVASTNPRDKVYSLLGIVDEINKISHIPLYQPDELIYDYEATVEDIYSSIVRAIVCGTRRLNVLLYCSKPGPLVSRTWTPDWTASMKKNFYYIAHFSLLNRWSFKASGDLDCIVSFSKDLKTLTARGLSLGVISIIQPVIVNGKLWKEFKRTLWRNFQLMQKQGTYGSDKERKLALARTLMIARYNVWIESAEKSNKEPDNPKFGKGRADDNTQRLVDGINIVSLVKPRASFFPKGKDQEAWRFDWSSTRLLSSLLYMMKHNLPLLFTDQGHVCTMCRPDEVKVGDIVCVLLGCPIPMVLRRVEDHYILIGDIYVDGVMYGEEIKQLNEGKKQLQDFVLH